ncbi:MAG: hypothetical protein FWC16_09995 [Defluviitaleaceae bacterium]|nr:hypothetical protein [Defluviitaleaceae bacterium]MCL2275246.1 hypothetical protein [Defluviitaleaceae bacterium]
MGGLLLTLKKRNNMVSPFNECPQHLTAQFNVFGYYDVLTVERVTAMSEFAPKSAKRAGDSCRNTYDNQYALRLIAYNLSQTSEQNWCFKPDPLACALNPAFYDNYPLFSIIKIRLTKDAILKKGFDGCVNEIASLIQAVQSRDAKYCGTAYYTLYYSLGAASVVVICRSNNITSVFGVLYNLRARHDLLSDSFVIPCIQSSSNSDELRGWDAALDSNIQFSIRARFQPFCTAKDLMHSLSEVLKNDEHRKFNRISGYSEFLTLTGCIADEHVKLYQNATINEHINNIASSIRTSIRMVTDAAYEDASLLELDCDMDELKSINKNNIVKRAESCNDFLQELSDLLYEHVSRCNNHSYRIYEGIMEMMNFYFDLSDQDSYYDIRYIYDEFFNQFLEIMRQYTEILASSGEAEALNALIEETCVGLNLFRERITPIINDINRSHKLWLEGRTLTHQVIGNSQKLIFSFTAIVRKVAEYLRDKMDDNENCTFIVTSGGTDDFEAIKFFGHLAEEKRRNDLLVLTLPEKKLFSFKSLFPVLHEMFHFAGDRLRNARAPLFLSSLTYHYSYRIANALLASKHSAWFNKDDSLAQKSVNQLCKHVYHYLSKHIISDELAAKLHYLYKEKADVHIYPVVKKALDAERHRGESGTNFDTPKPSDFMLQVSSLYTLMARHYTSHKSKQSVWNVAMGEFDDIDEAYCKERFYDDEAKECRSEVRALLNQYLNYNDSQEYPLYFTPEEEVEEVRFLYQECFADACSSVLLGQTIEDYLLDMYPAIAGTFDEFENKLEKTSDEFDRFFIVAGVAFPSIIGQFAEELRRDNSHGIRTENEIQSVATINAIRTAIGKIVTDEEAQNKYRERFFEEFMAFRGKFYLYKELQEYVRLCVENLTNVTSDFDFINQIRSFYRAEKDECIMKLITDLHSEVPLCVR